MHVQFAQKFPKMITLKELQKFAKDGGVLENMQVLKQARLSVSKVTKKEWYVLPKMTPRIDVTRHVLGPYPSASPESAAHSSYFDFGAGMERGILTPYLHRDFIMSLNDAEYTTAGSAA